MTRIVSIRSHSATLPQPTTLQNQRKFLDTAPRLNRNSVRHLS
jgi:hypothetical protein